MVKKSSSKKSNKSSTKQSFWRRVWNIICWPFRAFWRLCKRIWKWLCDIELVGMVNLTLLVAIIVLFSMLIIDVLNWRGCEKNAAPRAIVKNTAPQIVVTDEIAPATTQLLPLPHDKQTGKMIGRPISVLPTPEPDVSTTQIARQDNNLYGDVIVDTRASASLLKQGTHIQGSLFLENMRKYVLPCDIVIEGDLHLRDINMLQFCGDFTITGNIYVSPRSSFGPIPSTARLGGYVIL